MDTIFAVDTTEANPLVYTLPRKEAERLVRELYRPTRVRPPGCRDYCYVGDGCSNCLNESPYFTQLFIDADEALADLATALEERNADL